MVGAAEGSASECGGGESGEWGRSAGQRLEVAPSPSPGRGVWGEEAGLVVPPARGGVDSQLVTLSTE